jgi:hypothetical protein
MSFNSAVASTIPSFAVSATSESCEAGFFDLMKSPSFSGVPVVAGETSIRGSPRVGQLDLGHLPDFDPRDADDRPGLEPLHVGEVGLQVVALPGEPARPSDGDDEERSENQGRDGHDADFQFRPGKRSCPWHLRILNFSSQLSASSFQLSASGFQFQLPAHSLPCPVATLDYDRNELM